MKRFVQGVLIAAVLLPLCGVSRAETMEERKQRIMRKYMRERQSVEQSDIALPENQLENERIADSEKLAAVPVDLNRRKSTAPPPQMMAPVPVQPATKSWFLDEEDPDVDPYADPFAADSGQDRGREAKSDWWSQWQARQEEMTAREAGTTPSYDVRGSAYEYQGQTYSGAEAGRYDYSRRSDQGSGYSYDRNPPATAGHQQSAGRLGPYGTTSYGSSPSGMLELPAPNQDAGSRSSQIQGYTPYQSPYQTERERQSGQGTTQQEKQEFMRTSPYQQWKDKNRQWDPTADDSRLNDGLRRNRR